MVLNWVSDTDGLLINQALDQVLGDSLEEKINRDGDALTNPDDTHRVRRGLFVLSRAAVKRIGTERLNQSNDLVQANEQHIMTNVRSRIKDDLCTPFRIRKQEIAELMHDTVNLNQANPAKRKSMGGVSGFWALSRTNDFKLSNRLLRVLEPRRSLRSRRNTGTHHSAWFWF